MQPRITPLRVLLGAGITTLFILMSLGNVSSGKWSVLMGWVFGFAAPVIGFGFAFTARAGSSGSSPNSNDPVASDTPSAVGTFRTKVLLFVGSVVVLLILSEILDHYHVAWRQYLH